MADSEVPRGKVKFTAGGTTFVVDNHYEYIKKIGHGAFGVVFEGTELKSRTKVAIKIEYQS